jgi:hypothetical protein
MTFLLETTLMAEQVRIETLPESAGYAVAQLVEALRYKPEGRGFDFRWGHWDFFVDLSLGPTQPLTEMSARVISWGGGGDKGGRCIGLTTLPPSCVDCLEMLEASTS